MTPEKSVVFSSLMRFDPHNHECYFANSAPDDDMVAEFLNYFDGSVARYSVAEYGAAPARDAVDLQAALFPTVDVSRVDAVYPPVGLQRHRPRLMREGGSGPLNLDWRSVAFTQVNEVRVPAQPGVYAFSSQCGVAGLPAHQVVFYVGQTENLRTRYGNYLEEASVPGGRELVTRALNEFEQIEFWYTVVPSPQDRLRLEEWMIRAIDPPANLRGRVGLAVPEAELIWRADA